MFTNRLMLTVVLAVILSPDYLVVRGVWAHPTPVTTFVGMIVGVATGLYAHFVVGNYRKDVAR